MHPSKPRFRRVRASLLVSVSPFRTARAWGWECVATNPKVAKSYSRGLGSTPLRAWRSYCRRNGIDPARWTHSSPELA